MHNLKVSYFFFKNSLGAPQEDTLDIVHFLSINSWNYIFNLTFSRVLIL